MAGSSFGAANSFKLNVVTLDQEYLQLDEHSSVNITFLFETINF